MIKAAAVAAARKILVNAGKFVFDFDMPGVTNTVALFKYDANRTPYILLGQRADNADAFAGYWSLPGGFLNTGQERLIEAAVREIKEETNLDLTVEDLVTIYMDDVVEGTDPRYTQVVNQLYGAVLSKNTLEYDTVDDRFNLAGMKAGDDIQKLAWVEVRVVMAEYTLAFQHDKLLKEAYSHFYKG